eukprot:CAMPEP_0169268010 /NCGR_PEP_ID=MMETSP1016-20121227/47519_1 /TAXON_ID=342587 /ORGANISM="Karlodinium micrum, Strain CCMP2283" /LENGTH=96 /DNA_ID=CAMNT_0009352587 /DNA_START=716 /DNA_END=1003 /DNA_ORIENTATION=-
MYNILANFDFAITENEVDTERLPCGGAPDTNAVPSYFRANPCRWRRLEEWCHCIALIARAARLEWSLGEAFPLAGIALATPAWLQVTAILLREAIF